MPSLWPTPPPRSDVLSQIDAFFSHLSAGDVASARALIAGVLTWDETEQHEAFATVLAGLHDDLEAFLEDLPDPSESGP